MDSPASHSEPRSGLEIRHDLVLPEELLEFAFSRSSGPGGQNVNKLASRAQLRVKLSSLTPWLSGSALARLRALAGPAHLTDAGEVLFSCDESRSQRANREQCLQKLRLLLLEALRPPRTRRPTKPTAGSRRRRLDTKKRRAQLKRDRRGEP